VLRGLDADNWRECVELRVDQGQENYVGSNLLCIAESAVERHWTIDAIYSAEEVVGMVVYGLVDGDTRSVPRSIVGGGTYVVHHFMIDYRHQGKGYGREALQLLVERLLSRPDCRELKLRHSPGNPAAELYKALGFRYTGEQWGGEPVMVLRATGRRRPRPRELG
jgi:diamine N-acetyltransferase